MNDIKVFSIGKIVNEEENVKVVVEQKYAEGLKGLEGYSHCLLYTSRLRPRGRSLSIGMVYTLLIFILKRKSDLSAHFQGDVYKRQLMSTTPPPLCWSITLP